MLVDIPFTMSANRSNPTTSTTNGTNGTAHQDEESSSSYYSESDDDQQYQQERSGMDNYLDALAQATSYQAIAAIKQVRHDLEMERKQADLALKMQKWRLRRIRNERRRRDRQEAEQRASHEPRVKRSREYQDLVSSYNHDMKVRKLQERFAHEEVCRECQVEKRNKALKITTKYGVERAQKMAELAEAKFQHKCDVAAIRHSIHMSHLQEDIEAARMRYDLTQKYGAKMDDSFFQ